LNDRSRLVEQAGVQTSESQGLVEAFVDRVLNLHDTAAVAVLFHPTFKDHDPIDIPGYARKRVQDVEYIKNLCAFLSSEYVDISFTLEEAFGQPDRIAYQLFGEGTIATDVAFESSAETNESVAIDITGSGTSRRTPTFIRVLPNQRTTLMETGRLIGDRLHVEYHSVGIFRIGNGQFTQRRGQIIVK